MLKKITQEIVHRCWSSPFSPVTAVLWELDDGRNLSCADFLFPYKLRKIHCRLRLWFVLPQIPFRSWWDDGATLY